MPKPTEWTGLYRIVETEVWDTDFLDLVSEACMEISNDGTGRFRFGALVGWMDCRLVKRGRKQTMEFSWEGYDEQEPVHGRGWAVLDGDVLRGHLYFHMGDDSSFVATRWEGAADEH